MTWSFFVCFFSFCSTSVTDVRKRLDKVAAHTSQAGRTFVEQQLVKRFLREKERRRSSAKKNWFKKTKILTLPLLALL